MPLGAVVVAAFVAAELIGTSNQAVALAEDFVAAGAAVCMWIGARRAGGPSRRGWRLLALALTCWVVGDFIWDGYALLHRDRPDVSLADAFYVVGYPLLALGLFR